MKLRDSDMRVIDISQRIRPDMLVYPGDPQFHSSEASSFRRGDMCEVSELRIGSHCGTHIDAPLHMIPDGEPLESMPLDLFIGPCRVLTIHAGVITDKMLMEHQIQEGERILLRTDASGRYQKEGRFNPTVLNERAAQYLLQQRIKLIGIDAPTIENMESSDGRIHKMILKAGIAILEGLCLEHAVQERYILSALPLSLDGENGSPCRAVLIEKE